MLDHETERRNIALGWAAMIISVALLRLVVPADWLVVALAGSVSLGMVVGAAAGWALLRRSGMPSVGLGRPMLVSLAAAVPRHCADPGVQPAQVARVPVGRGSRGIDTGARGGALLAYVSDRRNAE